MGTGNHSIQGVLGSAIFELNEATKRLKRLDSSLTSQSLGAGHAGTNDGYAIFVILNRYTDLLDDCQKQCLAINRSLHYISTRNSPVLIRLFNWQFLREPLDLQTSIRMLERMYSQLQEKINVFATAMASSLANDHDAFMTIMFTADMQDLRDARENLEAARKLLIEAELLQISANSSLPEQTWDFISADELRVLLARDYQELAHLLEVDARKSALILCGSIMEAALVSVLKDIAPVAQSAYSLQFPRSQKSIEEWRLWELIAIAQSCNVIDQDTRRQADILRDYRNLIHPLVETRRATELDDELVQAQVTLLKRLLRMLSRSSTNSVSN